MLWINPLSLATSSSLTRLFFHSSTINSIVWQPWCLLSADKKSQKIFWEYDVSCDARVFSKTLLRAGSTVTGLNNALFISTSELLVRGVIFFHSEWYLQWEIALLHMTEGGAATISVETLSSLGVMPSTPGHFLTFISLNTSWTWVTSAVAALRTSINWRRLTPRLTILSNLN